MCNKESPECLPHVQELTLAEVRERTCHQPQPGFSFPDWHESHVCDDESSEFLPHVQDFSHLG